MATPETPDVIPELAELRKPVKAFSVPAPKELTGLSTEMGRGVPGVPEDFAKATAQYKKPSDVQPALMQMSQRNVALGRDIGMAQQAKAEYESEAKYDIAKQEREAAQNIEFNLDATRAKFPYPEFHPTKDNIESLSTLFGLIGVVGMAMGGAGKNSATMALNSMGGMMKGWQQGRADLWKKEKDEFDKSMAKVKAVLDDAYKDADRAMKTLAYNRQEAEALAGQSAAKLGGQVLKQVLDKQGVEAYVTRLTELKKDLQHQEEFEFKKSERSETRAYQNRMIELKEKEILNKAKGDLPSYIMEKTGARLAEKDATEVATAANAIGHAYALKEMVAQHPEWVGRKGQIGQFFNRYVDSLQSGKPLPADDANLAKDKSGQEALVFAKDYAAYLVNYERAIAGGAKGFTVSFQNRFNKLLDQNQFSQKGFENLMDQHIDEITRIAATKSPAKINKQNLTAVGMDINKDDPYAVAGFNRFAGVKTPSGAGGGDVETQAKKSFGSYEPDKYEYGYEDGKFYRDKK
jgi:hypothetical protein